jgi:alpha-ketoglutarate-dependent taurine dioxygenase
LVGTYHGSSIVAVNYEDDVYAHEWQVGNLAVWSNRLLIHTATSTRREEGKTAHKDTRSRDKDALMAWKGVQ